MLLKKREKAEIEFATKTMRRSGRDWFHRAAEEYGTAHKPGKTAAEVKTLEVQKRKGEAKRLEAGRELAKHIAEMDREAKRKLKKLEKKHISRLKKAKALIRVRAVLTDEEMKLEHVERGISSSKRKTAHAKKTLAWIKKRKKEMKREMESIDSELKKLSSSAEKGKGP